MSIARVLIGVAAVAAVGYGAKKLWDVMSEDKRTVVKSTVSFAASAASAVAQGQAAEASERRRQAELAAAARIEQERLLHEQEIAERRRQMKKERKALRERMNPDVIVGVRNGNFGSAVEFEEVSDNVVNLSDRLRQNRGFGGI